MEVLDTNCVCSFILFTAILPLPLNDVVRLSVTQLTDISFTVWYKHLVLVNQLFQDTLSWLT